MNHIQALENEIAQLKEEFEKFERGNKSAGTRARKVLQNIKRISQDIRDHIQEVKKGDETEEKA
jgi:exonuclease VII small subunit